MLKIDVNRYDVHYNGKKLFCLQLEQDISPVGRAALEKGNLQMMLVYLDDDQKLQCELVDSRKLIIIEKPLDEQRAAQFHPWSLDEIDQPPVFTTNNYLTQKEGA